MPNRPKPTLRWGGYVQLHLARHRGSGDLYIVEELIKPAAHKRIVLAVAGPLIPTQVCSETGTVYPSWVARWRNENSTPLRPDRAPWALEQDWEWLAGHVIRDADRLRWPVPPPVIPWTGQGTPLQQEIGAAPPPQWVYNAFAL